MTAATSGDIAARLDRLPSSRTVWRIVTLISLGGVFEFYVLFFTAYVAPGMIASGLFTPQSLGIFASLKSLQVAGFGTFVFSTDGAPPDGGQSERRSRSGSNFNPYRTAHSLR